MTTSSSSTRTRRRSGGTIDRPIVVLLPSGTINAQSPGGASASIVPISVEMLIAKPTSRPLSIRLQGWVRDYTHWDAWNLLVRASEVAETGMGDWRNFLSVNQQALDGVDLFPASRGAGSPGRPLRSPESRRCPDVRSESGRLAVVRDGSARLTPFMEGDFEVQVSAEKAGMDGDPFCRRVQPLLRREPANTAPFPGCEED